jgi:23S rRNA pseudouridine1911/1915/1917 synthase
MRVPALSAPTRLDVFLASSGAMRTRSQAKSWIDAGSVRVDGKARKAGFVLAGGEAIEVRPLPEAPSRPEPENLPLEILYEDDELVAIDKPAGMVVHPAPGAWRGTVVNALLHRRLVTHDLSEGRPGIVHRLDKETSGVLLVARTRHAQQALASAFHDRQVEKHYLAIVLGVPRSPAGSLEWTIGRHPHERKRMSIRSRSPRSARTRYTLLESFSTLSLLRLEPETGRTHQIRVHLRGIRHPIVGDRAYGGGGDEASRLGLTRPFLHAARLSFPHPSTGATIEVEEPLPEELATALELARQDG